LSLKQKQLSFLYKLDDLRQEALAVSSS